MSARQCSFCESIQRSDVCATCAIARSFVPAAETCRVCLAPANLNQCAEVCANRDLVYCSEECAYTKAVEAPYQCIGRKHGKGGRKGRVSRAKAREILHDGTAHGRPLTDRQRRYFGWIAGGSKPRKK